MNTKASTHESSGRRFRLCLLAGTIAGLLALSVVGPGPARATPLGQNGRIAFAANGVIYTVTWDPSGKPKPLPFSGDNREPTFSSDGTLIAFASNHNGSYDIWVVDSAFKTPPIRLTQDSGAERSPAFQPLTHLIAYVAPATPNGPTDLWTIEAKRGSSPQQLTKTPDAERDPAWSQNGQELAFVRGGDIWKMPAAGPGAATQLTSGAPDDRQLSWFFGKIAFARSTAPGGNADIWTMKAKDGSDPKNLTNDAADESDPAGSPDGKLIAYIGPYLGSPHLLVGLNGTWGGLPLPNMPASPTGPDWEGIFTLGNIGGGQGGSQLANLKLTPHGTSIELEFDLPEAHTGVDVVATDSGGGVYNGLKSSASPTTHWKVAVVGLTPGTTYTLKVLAGSYKSGEFNATTLKRNVAVTFRWVSMHDDSDPGGCGEFVFGARLLSGGTPSGDMLWAAPGPEPVDICDGESWDNPDVTVELKNVKTDNVSILLVGVDDDCFCFPVDTFYAPFDLDGVKDLGEWSDATWVVGVAPNAAGAEAWSKFFDMHVEDGDGNPDFTYHVKLDVSYGD